MSGWKIPSLMDPDLWTKRSWIFVQRPLSKDLYSLSQKSATADVESIRNTPTKMEIGQVNILNTSDYDVQQQKRAVYSCQWGQQCLQKSTWVVLQTTGETIYNSNIPKNAMQPNDSCFYKNIASFLAGRMLFLKDVCLLKPETYEYALLHDRRKLVSRWNCCHLADFKTRKFSLSV